MRPPLPRKKAIASIVVLSMVLIVSCFILILYHDWNASRDEAMRRLERLMTVVQGSEFNKEKQSRSFVYVYDLENVSSYIDVIDKSFMDWEKVHRSSPAFESQRFERILYASQNSYDNEWLNSLFKVENEKHGIVLTPNNANAIQYIDQSKMDIPDLPDIRIWLSRDTNKNKLYMLVRIISRSFGKSENFILRLVLYQDNIEERISSESTLRIAPEENGEIGVTRAGGEIETVIRGNWWKKEGNQFFELSLDGLQLIDVVEPIVVMRSEDKRSVKAVFRTPSALPLNEEITTYPIVKHLSQTLGCFEVYRKIEEGVDTGTHRLARTLASCGQAPIPGARQSWQNRLLTPVYLNYFYPKNIGPCTKDKPEQTGQCFYADAYGYRLRLGRALPKMTKSEVEEYRERHGKNPPKSEEIRVFTEVPLVPRLRGLNLVIPVIILALALALVREDGARRHRYAYRMLEQTYARLQSVNETLRDYAGIVQHQIRDRLARILTETRRLGEDADGITRSERLTEIQRLIAYVRQHLEDSTEAIRYEELVREELEKYGQHKFNLYNTMVDIVENFVNEESVDNIEFRNLVPGNRSLYLPSTAPPTSHAPDSRFIEAMEMIIQNAVDYRDPHRSTVTVSLDVKQTDGDLPYAVLRVSNYGPTIPDDIVRSAFDLNTRFQGATTHRSQVSAGGNEQSKEHLGLGLFRLSQITRAYGGTCQLKNFSDRAGSGVVATVKLPAEYGHLDSSSADRS